MVICVCISYNVRGHEKFRRHLVIISFSGRNLGKRNSATFENNFHTLSWTSYTLLGDVIYFLKICFQTNNKLISAKIFKIKEIIS